MSDSSILEQGTEQNHEESAGVAGGDSGKSPFPGYVTGILNKEQQEALKAEYEVDHSVVERLPKDPSSLFAEWRSLNSKMRTAVQVPGKDATDEQKAAYRKAMGIPDAVDGYTFDHSNIPQELYDQNFEQAFRQFAHEHGVPLKTAQELYGWYNNHVLNAVQDANQKKAQDAQAQAEAREKAAKEAIATLQGEWGEKFPQRIAGARDAYKNDRIVSPTLRQKLEATGLGNDPDMVRLMDVVHSATRSDRMIGLSAEAGESGTKGIDYGDSFKSRYKGRAS